MLRRTGRRLRIRGRQLSSGGHGDPRPDGRLHRAGVPATDLSRCDWFPLVAGSNRGRKEWLTYYSQPDTNLRPTGLSWADRLGSTAACHLPGLHPGLFPRLQRAIPTPTASSASSLMLRIPSVSKCGRHGVRGSHSVCMAPINRLPDAVLLPMTLSGACCLVVDTEPVFSVYRQNWRYRPTRQWVRQNHMSLTFPEASRGPAANHNLRACRLEPDHHRAHLTKANCAGITISYPPEVIPEAELLIQ